MDKNYFIDLNSINVNDHVESKGGLKYLSWSWAWQEVKKYDPEANYEILERQTEFGPVNYFTDGRTCWVKTTVTIKGITHIEELPIMNNSHRSIMLDAVTSTDVNTAIQRSLTKAIARHGLGLYLYAGEDLPDVVKEAPEVDTAKVEAEKKAIREAVAQKPVQAQPAAQPKAPAQPKKAVSAVEPSNVPESADLEGLRKEIGRFAKKSRDVYGSLEKYNNIVREVTGSTSFKCNVAEEKDIPVLKEILKHLMEDPNLR